MAVLQILRGMNHAVMVCSKPAAAQLALVWQQLLHADLREAGRAALPAGISDKHDWQLRGKYLVQIDEMVNIAENAEARGRDTASRMLKLSMTDGGQRVFGLECALLPALRRRMTAHGSWRRYRRVSDLSVDMLPGCKVRLRR